LLKKYHLKHVIEGHIEGRVEVTERQGRGLKQLLDELEDKRGLCKIKEIVLNRPL
jgi:hypothetical protein